MQKMESQQGGTTAKWAVILIATAVLCGLAAITYFNRTGIARGLRNLKLVPAPEAFTELYFNNSGSLPKTVVAGKPLTFSFTVHNEEGTTTPYPYEVYFEYPNGTRLTFMDGTVSLTDGVSTAIDVSHNFQSTDAQGKVVVELTGRNQQIDFLLPNNNG